MIRKVYEVNPMVCPKCGGTMKVVAFLTDYAVVDRIIDYLKLTFVADRPPPPQSLIKNGGGLAGLLVRAGLFLAQPEDHDLVFLGSGLAHHRERACVCLLLHVDIGSDLAGPDGADHEGRCHESAEVRRIPDTF
jgi:hypothetical protein